MGWTPRARPVTAGDWREADPARLEPVVLVAGGLLTNPGWYRAFVDALRRRGASDVVVAPVWLPDWVLAAPRGLGPITTRTGRALLEACRRSEAGPSSRGAPLLLVGHSAGGLVGRLLTSPAPFEGRRLGASGRIGALVTLGTPHAVGADARWGRRIDDAGLRFANRHVPGACFSPTTAYLTVGSRFIEGRVDATDERSRLARRIYDDVAPCPGEPVVVGDGLVPDHATRLPGARHVVLDDAIHGPGLRAAWYGQEARLDAWWPAALELWRGALAARLRHRPG